MGWALIGNKACLSFIKISSFVSTELTKLSRYSRISVPSLVRFIVAIYLKNYLRRGQMERISFKPYKQIQVKFPDDTYRKLVEIAQHTGIHLNELVGMILEWYFRSGQYKKNFGELYPENS